MAFITARKRSCRKVMFSQVCVSPQGVGISGPVSFRGGGISGIRSLPGVVIYLGDGYVQGDGYSPPSPDTWDTTGMHSSETWDFSLIILTRFFVCISGKYYVKIGHREAYRVPLHSVHENALWYRHAHSGITGRTEQLLKNMLHAYLPGRGHQPQGKGRQAQGKGASTTREGSVHLKGGASNLKGGGVNLKGRGINLKGRGHQPQGRVCQPQGRGCQPQGKGHQPEGKGASTSRDGASTSREGLSTSSERASTSREGASTWREGGINLKGGGVNLKGRGINLKGRGHQPQGKGASTSREGASTSREGASTSREGASTSREGGINLKGGGVNLKEGASTSREGGLNLKGGGINLKGRGHQPQGKGRGSSYWRTCSTPIYRVECLKLVKLTRIVWTQDFPGGINLKGEGADILFRQFFSKTKMRKIKERREIHQWRKKMTTWSQLTLKLKANKVEQFVLFQIRILEFLWEADFINHLFSKIFSKDLP